MIAAAKTMLKSQQRQNVNHGKLNFCEHTVFCLPKKLRYFATSEYRVLLCIEEIDNILELLMFRDESC